MSHITKTRSLILSIAILLFVVVGWLPQHVAHSSDILSASDIGNLLIGNTVFGRAEVGHSKKYEIIYAEYFAPSGEAMHRVIDLSTGKETTMKGRYYFRDGGEFCTYYPTLNLDQKEFCVHFISLDDGRYRTTPIGVIEKILEGERLLELK